MTHHYRPIIAPDAFGSPRASMEKASNGSYVRLVDYEALKADRDALQQLVRELTAHVRVGKP